MNTTLRALVNQAERLVRTEAYEEAIALCHAILRRYPRYARAYRILAEAHLGLGEHGTAADLFRRALGVDPEDPVGYAGLGIIFAERGLREEAIWQLERAFELAPGRDGLRRELARLYEERGSSTQAQLTRAALARLYTRGGLWNKAIGELRDLVAREPYRLDLRATLVRTLWRAGQREEAARVAQTALDQAPNCLVARLVLGAYWCDEGRDDEGRRLLEGARELDPEGREVGRLLRKAWPQLLDVQEGEAEVEVEAEPEVEEPAEPAISSPEPSQPADLPPWLGADEATGGHIATLPGASTRGLLDSLGEQDLEAEDDEVSPLAPPEEEPPPGEVEQAWPLASSAQDEAPPEEVEQASPAGDAAWAEPPEEVEDVAPEEAPPAEPAQAWPMHDEARAEPPDEPAQAWPADDATQDEAPEEAEPAWPAPGAAWVRPPEEAEPVRPAPDTAQDEAPREEPTQAWPARDAAWAEPPEEEEHVAQEEASPEEPAWPTRDAAQAEPPPEQVEQAWPARGPLWSEPPKQEEDVAPVGDATQDEAPDEELEDARPAAEAAQPAAPRAPAAPPAPERAPFGHDAPSPLLAPAAVWQRRLDAAPEDHHARLALARALVESGRLGEALPHYATLSTQPAYLERVLADLEAAAKVNTSDRLLREHLGDAYARAGRFQDALRMYHWHPEPPNSNDNAAGG